LLQPPFARGCDDNFLRLKCSDQAFEFTGQAAGVLRVVIPGIADPPALFAQSFGVVTHCGENEGDLFFVMLHIGRFFADLCHENHILFRIGVS